MPRGIGLQIVSGTWKSNGGTLNSTAVGQSDIVKLTNTSDWRGNALATKTRAPIPSTARGSLNEFGASGNSLVWSTTTRTGGKRAFYGGDYLEIVFSPTGDCRSTSSSRACVIRSPRCRHNIPRNTWFDVQVIRTVNFTEVKVNGAAS